MKEVFFRKLQVGISQLHYELTYERDVLKNFLKLTDKLKKQSPRDVLSKVVLKSFAKFTEKHLSKISFSVKLQVGNLKLTEAATGAVQ